MASRGIAGPLSPLLGQITTLTILVLWNNSINGSIPASLGSLTNLVSLSLGTNNLTGSIPGSFQNLTLLTALELGSNSLTGTVPDLFWKLTRLVSLSLGGNQVKGSIPTSLERLTNLTALNLSRNRVSGVVPSGLSKVTGLKKLYLDSNFLTGVFPGLPKTNLGSWSLSNNYFYGQAPLAICPNASAPTLRGNCFSGSAGPCSISNRALSACKAFCGLTYNAPACSGRGTCSPSASTASSSSPTFVCSGCANGSVAVGPTCAPAPPPPSPPSPPPPPPSARDILLAQNALWGNFFNWTGPNPCVWYDELLCNSKKDVVRISIGNRGFSGTLSPLLGQLTGLSYLDVQGNGLTGTIPDSFGGLTNMVYLYLARNALTGSIPEGFKNFKSLDHLYVSYNKLTGPILPSLSPILGQLEVLLLNNNYFTGVFPQYNRTRASTVFSQTSIDNNFFYGPAPTAVCQIQTLSGNCFSGAPVSPCDIANRSPEECSAFCGLNSTSPACSGLGTCVPNAEGEGFSCS